MVSLAAASCRAGDTLLVSGNLTMIKHSEGIWIHQSYFSSPVWGRFPSNGLVLVHDREALLIDTPMSDSVTAKLLDWITHKLGARITGFVATHWHEDCMGGLDIVHDRGIPSYALQLTRDIALEKGLPLPRSGFADTLMLRSGPREIHFTHPGRGHTSDNIVVWIPEEHFLFAGCLVKSADTQSLGHIADADLEAWPETIRRVLERYPDAATVVPGHGPGGGIELLHHTLRLIRQHKEP